MPERNKITVISPEGNRYELTPYGRSYTESSELIMREDRAASGRLRRDVVAEKKTFSLSYDNIDTIGLEMFEELFRDYSGKELGLEVIRRSSGGIDTLSNYPVLMRPFSRQRAANGLWAGVTVEFVEV